ncbi:MAG: hypothetical protein AB9M53_05315 [Leptothrix sp. (in: b-proteobacteria)]
MDYQEWECFDSEINSRTYTIVGHGPLFGPVTSFSIKRDKDLNLLLESTSASNSVLGAPEPAANAVYRPDGNVDFRNISLNGISAVASGIIQREYKINLPTSSTSDSASNTKTQTSIVTSLEWSNAHCNEATYIMDWIENLSNDFIWPDSDDVDITETKIRTLGSRTNKIEIPFKTTSLRRSNSCVRLSVGGWDVIIGNSRYKSSNVKLPGFILYLGLPDKEARSRIRGCLSYCFGDYFVHLGSTTYDQDWELVSFHALSAHALVEVAGDISRRPPAPLGEKYEREVDARLLSSMASGLYAAYDAYNLRTAFWNYWHAIAAPVHMAAAHFGAAIESLQRAYFKNNENSVSDRIVVNKDFWKALHDQINNLIQESSLSSEEKRLLSNKAQHLNSAPQAIVADRFFDAIGLTVGNLEKDVWKNRNRAAHGAGVTEERGIQSIRDNKILMTLMNRIMLSISKSSDCYYDYYTIHRPKRRLAEAVPDDRPTGGGKK